MKKTFLFIMFSLLLFIPISSVRAAEPDCNNYACGTCTYSVLDGKYKVTYDIQSNGTSLQIVDIKTEQAEESWGRPSSYEFENELVAQNFYNQTTNKMQCPGTIYSTITGKVTGNVATTIVKFTPEKGNLSTAANPKLAAKTNNDKPVKKVNADPTISCDYNVTTTVGNEQVKCTVATDSKTMDISCTKGYKVSLNTITASLFKNSSGKLICPEIYVSCGSSGNDKYCSFQPKEANTGPNRPGGGGGSTGNVTPDAEQFPSDPNDPNNPSNPDDGFDVKDGCGMLGAEGSAWLQWIFNIIKIGGPILAIVLGMLDFAKAVFAGEDDSMKKASKKFMYRLIAAMLLFLIPFFLDILLNFIGVTSSTCGIR